MSDCCGHGSCRIAGRSFSGGHRAPAAPPDRRLRHLRRPVRAGAAGPGVGRLRHAGRVVAARRRGRPRRAPVRHGGPGDRRRDRPVGRASTRLVDVLADLRALPERGRRPSTPTGSSTRCGCAAARCATGSASPPTWPGSWPRAELPRVPLRPFTAAALGLPPDRDGPAARTRPAELPVLPRRARAGRAAPRAALRRVRGGHRPARPGAADPDRRRLPRRAASGTCPAAAPTTASSRARR